MTPRPRPSRPQDSSRLVYIDGMRGIVSLWIVLTHCYWEIFPDGGSGLLASSVAAALQPIAFSNKVAIFIVISGYCLFLPLVRRGCPIVTGGVSVFLKRRASRILLPYYGALALSLGLIALFPVLRLPQGLRWDVALPAFTPSVIVSHVLMLHNLSPEWVVRINPPMWSLAVEWQIYFLFLFALLPLWRRFRLRTALAAGFVCGFLPHFLLPADRNFDWTAPWYLSLFCLGAAAAAVFYDGRVHRAAFAGLLVFGLITMTIVATRSFWLGQAPLWRPWIDLSVGLLTACFLAYNTNAVTRNQRTPGTRICESKVFQELGTISYSLYLIHFPLLSLLHAGILSLLPGSEASPLWRLGLLFLLGTSLSVLASYIFHRLCDRVLEKGFAASKTGAIPPRTQESSSS